MPANAEIVLLCEYRAFGGMDCRRAAVGKCSECEKQLCEEHAIKHRCGNAPAPVLELLKRAAEW